ncbi:MAG TPA: LysM peptidoglycan-binding domain-containing protein [Micavibrio sp.]|nr:LysM peptidoglycan-binding domain-containing protein [Micavibrio sp.]
MVDAPKMTTKGQLFWNAYGNLQAGIESQGGYDFNRELLTHIQADERYVSYVDEYLATAPNLTEPKEDIHARAVSEHEKSLNALETGSGYSADVQGLANDFFFVIEQDYERAGPAPGDYTTQQRIDDAFTVVQNATTVTGEKPFDKEFAKTQLGDLAQTPDAKTAPVTESIKPENMPAPVAKEIEPAETTAAVQEEAPKPENASPLETASKPETANRPENASKLENTAKPEDTRTTADYIVERGDSLWKIAKEYYGLNKPAEIQRTVDYIASVNGLDEGTAANHIKTGQAIQLPDSPLAPEGTKRLDWEALDAETKKGLRGKFAAAVNNELPDAQPARVADIAYTGPAATPG